MYSASSTTATRRGVPPTALSSPTRRVWSAIRPPTRTATPATASNPSSQLPVRRTLRRVLDHFVVPVADVLPRLQGWCGPARREAIVDERRRVGRVGQLQVHDVGETFLRGGETAGVRLGEPDQAGLDRVHGRLGIDGRLFPWRATIQRSMSLEGQAEAHIRIWPRGGGDRHAHNLEGAAVHHTTVRLLAANPKPTDTGPQGDLVPYAEFERVGEAGLDDHSAVAYPAALGQLGLVDGGRCGVAALCPRPRSTEVLPAQVSSGDAVRLEFHPDERIRPAVVGDAGSVGQRLERGEVGGLTEDRVPAHTGDDVGPGCGLPGALVGLVGNPVQDEPEGQRGRGGHDRQQQERGFCRAPAHVSRGEAADEQEAAHRFSSPVRRARRAARWCRGSAWSPRRRRRRASRSAGRRLQRCGRRG